MTSEMTNPAILIAYRRLAGEILEQAFRDARSCYPKRAALAKQWLIYSALADDLLAAMNVDRYAVIDIVKKIGYNEDRVRGDGE